jgi:outer membrane protein insertion porin family
MIFAGILSSHAAGAYLQTNPSPRQQLVEVVEIQGNRRLKDEVILAHIKTRPGDPFSESQIRHDLQRMIESGLFDQTRTRVITEAGVRGGSVVIFDVFELPLILEVTFRGLEMAGIGESEIVKALRENRINLAKGEVCDAGKVRAALRVIQDLLASRGRGNVRVEAHLKMDSPTDISIEFSFAYAGQ